MNLVEIIDKNQKSLESISDPSFILSLSKFEQYVDESYQGRLFFELIQNARDAAFQINASSEIFITVTNNKVIFANTGQPFNEGGVLAMTRLGLSEKTDKELIGHKGIGFKAIQEFTKEPKIITQFGSIYFNKSESRKMLDEKFPGIFLKENQIPLFSYPFFDKTTTIDYNPVLNGKHYDTIIEFPLNKTKSDEDIIRLFSKITDEELVLLGNIHSITFNSDELNNNVLFESQGDVTKIITNGKAKQFQIFRPIKTVTIPDNIFEKLDENEQDLYQDQRSLDIKIAVELNKEGKAQKQKAKLFLFYPLEIYSGFEYIIHSNFSVNPERTMIRDTPLNKYLFEEIARMQVEILLPFFKMNCVGAATLEFVYFERANEKLGYLYDCYVEELKKTEFVWLEKQEKFVTISEIILCSAKLYDLFNKHQIKGLYPVSFGEKLNKFFKDEFNVPVFQNADLPGVIDAVCNYERENPKFFEKLYNYAMEFKLDLSAQQVLLSSQQQLYSKKDDVFYASRYDYEIPAAISDKIITLHHGIRINPENLGLALKNIGIKEFRIEEVVKKALEILEYGQEEKFAMLFFLKSLPEISDTAKKLIRSGAHVPAIKGVSGTMEWINPLYDPVYFKSTQLIELYPEGYFVDIDSCINYGGTASEWESFFLKYGVWDKPGVYVRAQSDENRRARISLLNLKNNKNAYGYTIYNDRVIDFPENVTYYFYESIFKSWKDYVTFVEEEIPLEFSMISNLATYRDRPEKFFEVTSFAYTLMTEAWFYTKEDQKDALHADEIYGLNRVDVTIEKYISKFLNILVIDYSPHRTGIIEALKIRHFNAYNVRHIVPILDKVSKVFSDREGTVLDSDFKRFYHAVLKYLYNTYSKHDTNREVLLANLKRINFLCKDISGNDIISWQQPQFIYHNDDRITFDQLADEARFLLKYFFTKNDKNEIGKIFSRIAKPLSQEVKPIVRSAEEIESAKFIDQIINLQYVIAVVEDSIEDHLNESVLSKLKDTRISVCNGLEKEIYLQSNNDYKDVKPLKFHYDSKANVVLLPKEYFPLLNHKALAGEIIDHVFSSLLDKDIDRARLFKDLISPINSRTFKEALNDFDYDNERLLEVESIFLEHNYTPAQTFWDAILFAKAQASDNVFGENGEIDFLKIAASFTASYDTIMTWNGSLNYIELNASANLTVLRDIISVEAILFDDVNAKLAGPITFEYLYKKEFNILKNKKLNRIKTILYEYFSRSEITVQRQFNFHLDNLEKLEPKEWSTPRIFYSIEDDLINELKEIYPEVDFSPEKFAVDGTNSWTAITKKLPDRKKALRTLFKKKNYNLWFFDSFVSSGVNYSLLFFEQYDELVSAYASLYPSVSVREDDADNDGSGSSPQRFESAETDTKEITACNLEGNELSPNSNFLEDALNKINKSGTRGGAGNGKASLPDQDYIKHIGREGEKLLYLKFVEIYGEENVKWVSENCPLLDFVPDKEAVGYDIRYVDKDHETHYVEVKTSVGDEPEFHISINEVRSARRHGANYHVIWINNLFSVGKRQYLDLQNMFMNFSEGEDFFHNSKFYPQLTGFKIIFRKENIKPSAETDT